MAQRKSPTRTRPATPATPEPEANPGFEFIPYGAGGGVRWVLGETTYLLRGPFGSMRTRDVRELDELRLAMNEEGSLAQNTALEMPAGTTEEQQAKYAALRAARTLITAHLDAFYDELFRRLGYPGGCPNEERPGWSDDPTFLVQLLLHLRGPLPRGAP